MLEVFITPLASKATNGSKYS